MSDDMKKELADRIEFEEALIAYIELLTQIHNEYYAKHYPNLTPPTFRTEPGQKWIRIVKQGMTADGNPDKYGTSVHSFVAATDVETKNITAQRGDIMKPAGWKAPAKHPRGSIFVDKGKPALYEGGFVNYL